MPRHVVVLLLHARLQLGHRVLVGRRPAGLELLLHLADEGGVLVEQLAVLGADRRADLLQVVLQVVEHALQALPVLHPAVELVEHLIGIVDRRDRLVRRRRRPCASRCRPDSGTITPNSSEPKRVRVAGSLCRMVLDLLVDRDAAGPAGRRVRAALDVAGEQLDAGQAGSRCRACGCRRRRGPCRRRRAGSASSFRNGSSGLRLSLSD